jgi:hypothetical protein
MKCCICGEPIGVDQEVEVNLIAECMYGSKVTSLFRGQEKDYRINMCSYVHLECLQAMLDKMFSSYAYVDGRKK